MESKQYCSLKSPEDAKKEMDDMTHREMEKLNKILKEKPQLLNKHSSDSSDSDSISISSSDSDEKHMSYRFYANEKKMDKLEERKHFATLEINNLMLENGELKKEIEELKNKNKSMSDMVHTILKIDDIKILDTFDGTRLTDMAPNLQFLTEIIINLEKQYKEVLSQICVLKLELENNFKEDKYENIKKAYYQNIMNFEREINKKFSIRRKEYEECIYKMNRDHHNTISAAYVIFILLISFVLYKFICFTL